MALVGRRWVGACARALSHGCAVHLGRIRMRARLRTVVSFAQIVTQMKRVYGLRFPEPFEQLLGAPRLTQTPWTRACTPRRD